MKIKVLGEEEIDGEKPEPSHRKLAHGFDVLSDGSVIFAFDNGVSLQRFDSCGSRIWAVGGNFHHAVTLDNNEESNWILRNRLVVKVAMATGENLQRFSINDIVAAIYTRLVMQARGQFV